MAEEYRYLMAYGELVGRSHGLKTPCQDKALCIQRDGVNVAALSDGCGSAPLSEYGSRLTVEAVANFLVNNFDQLITNGFREDSHANLETRKALVKEIVDLELRMIKEDPEMNEVFSRYKEEHLDQYNSYLSRHTEECYWLSLMHATIVFFAEKNGKAIFGQIGDGFLGLLASGNMRIFIEEEKIPGAKNATCYPDNIYEFALTRPEGDKWYFYRSFKMGTASSEHIEAVMLTSDGVDSFFDKSVRYQMKYAQNAVNGLFGRIIQAESFEGRQDIINNMYLPKLVAGSSTFDDCSIALLVSPNAKVENCVVKEYPHDEEETDEVEYDEHIWLSLKYASSCAAIITTYINELDKDNEAKYNTNCNNYAKKLSRLDLMYQNNLSNTRFDTLVFGDRFPFLYLVKDYDINYYAAFNGCSAEAEASFKTITKLASIVDELGLRYVIKLEGTNNRIAETVVEATQDKNQKILILDSMQSKTLKDASKGVTYLSIMEDNLEVLIKALN